MGERSVDECFAALVSQSQSLRVKVQNSVIRPVIKETGEWPADGQVFSFEEIYERAEQRPAREMVLQREISKAEAAGETVVADVLRGLLEDVAQCAEDFGSK